MKASKSVLKHQKAWWYLMMLVDHMNDTLWCLMTLNDALWRFMTPYDALWCFMMLHDASWCFMMLHDASWLVLYHSRWCNDWFIDVLGFWWLTNRLTDRQRLLLSGYRDWKFDVDVGVQLAQHGLYLGLRYSGSGSGGHLPRPRGRRAWCRIGGSRTGAWRTLGGRAASFNLRWSPLPEPE